MNLMLASLAEVFRSKQFAFSVEQNEMALYFVCTGKPIVWYGAAIVTGPDDSLLIFKADLPVRVPPAQRAACATLLTRHNFGRSLGAFQFDLEDGTVHFVFSQILTGRKVSGKVVDHFLAATFAAMDEVGLEIFKLVFGHGSPIPIANDSTEPANQPRLEFN